MQDRIQLQETEGWKRDEGVHRGGLPQISPKGWKWRTAESTSAAGWESEAGSMGFHPIRAVFSGFCFSLKIEHSFSLLFSHLLTQGHVVKREAAFEGQGEAQTNTSCQLQDRMHASDPKNLDLPACSWYSIDQVLSQFPKEEASQKSVIYSR